MDCKHCDHEMELIEDNTYGWWPVPKGERVYECANDACDFLIDNKSAYMYVETEEDREADYADYRLDQMKDEE